MSDPAVHRRVLIGGYEVQAFVTNESWRQLCYLVCHLESGDQVLIDPGEELDEITKAIEHAGPLRGILLTHAHHDHVGGVSFFCRKHGLSCRLHRDDTRLLRHAPMYAQRFAGRRMDPVTAVTPFESPWTLPFGRASIQSLHSPGHTQGSVCYDFGDFCFTGDTLLYRKIGRTDLPGGDATLLRASVTRMIETLQKETVVLFPGHGRSWTVAEARSWWEATYASGMKALDRAE